MDKRTLKFHSLHPMAEYSKKIFSGFLMNTNNHTLTGRFTDEEINMALNEYEAQLIKTTDKVFSYGNGNLPY